MVSTERAAGAPRLAAVGAGARRRRPGAAPGRGEGTIEIAAETILVAIGRVPNTDDLGLDVVGVELDGARRIVVDASRRAARRVLAIGDVTAGPALAHKAIAEAEVAAATAAGKRAAFDPAAIPQIVFCDPEIASVGMTRDEAVAAGRRGRRASVFR